MSLANSSSEHAVFLEREQCVSCGNTDLQVIWQGRFCDEPTRTWMRAMHYSGDVEHALGDETFSRVACRTCGMSFHQRILTDNWLATLYSEWISSAQISAYEGNYQQKTLDAKFIEGTQNIKHLLRLRQLSQKQGRHPLRLLDFGCGDGKFLRIGAALGFKVFGVDPSISRRARSESAGIPIAASLDELNTGDGYDCVTLFEVLEHVANPRGILEALRTRMSTHAVLVIEVPDCQGIGVPRSFDHFGAIQPLEHINHFTPSTLSALCRRVGFIPAPRVPAHVTTDLFSIVKTEASRLFRRTTTSQYFRRV
jgi:SAM-dependent methyltransferase